jgi:hypothetical protein
VELLKVIFEEGLQFFVFFIIILFFIFYFLFGSDMFVCLFGSDES